MKILYWYISDFFSFIANILVFVFEVLGSCIGLIKDCLTGIVNLFTSMPGIFYVPFVALISIGLIYKILGREGSD